MIVPPALLSGGHSEPRDASKAFLCLLLETANMRVDQILDAAPRLTAAMILSGSATQWKGFDWTL